MEQNNYLSKYTTDHENGCKIFYDHHAATGHLLSIAAHISVEHPLHLLDFGNRCDMYYVARQLRYLTKDPVAAMNNFRLQRAFTCYQALALLRQMEHMKQNMTVIILDLLAPFLDENIKTDEIYRLFHEAADLLQYSMRERLLLIGVKPVPQKLAPDRVYLINDLARTFGLIVVQSNTANHDTVSLDYQARPAVRAFGSVRNDTNKLHMAELPSGQLSLFDLLPEQP